MSTPRQQFAKRLLSEGVAAPLEPTRQELAEALQAEWASSGTFHFDFTGWLIEKVRCAAAVSKNLQEAYDREHAWLNNYAETLKPFNRTTPTRKNGLRTSKKNWRKFVGNGTAHNLT